MVQSVHWEILKNEVTSSESTHLTLGMIHEAIARDRLQNPKGI